MEGEDMFNDCICFIGLIFGLSVIMAYVYIDPGEFENRLYYHLYCVLNGVLVGALANAVYIAAVLLALFGSSLVR